MATNPPQALPFPYAERVAVGLLLVNPSLSPDQALLHARSIVIANDRGCMEEAWAYLDAALTVGQHPVPRVVPAPVAAPVVEAVPDEELALV